MGKIYTFNNKIVTLNNKWCEEYVEPTPPPPTFDEVTIGTQTWKNVNLAIDDGQGGITAFNVGVVNGVDLGTQYYYNFDAAVRVANSIPGWHLPSNSEWDTLASYVGSSVAGNKLKSTTGWNGDGNGTDDYGFTALPNGVLLNGSFLNALGNNAYFWTSTVHADPNYGNYRGFGYNTSSMSKSNYVKSNGVSVRLIKDT